MKSCRNVSENLGSAGSMAQWTAAALMMSGGCRIFNPCRPGPRRLARGARGGTAGPLLRHRVAAAP
ncbi:hypothetical protein D516_3895 [Rhodobacter sp. AKP1]|nr:hypothetical protein D516_3895 [Rhodobacter sp. AKP1]